MEPTVTSIAATVAVILWCLFALVLFATQPIHRAGVLSILLGTLYLPELVAWELPVFPDLNKKTIATLPMFLAMIFRRRQVSQALRLDRMTVLLFLLMFTEDFARVIMNRDAIYLGNTVVDGLKIQTGLTFALEDTFRFLVPVCAGFIATNRPGGAEEFLGTLTKVGLVYLLLVVIELRLSPQLHYWTYGYYQHSWEQAVRSGGYRPTVFMPHGLAVALFIGGCCLITATARKARLRVLGLGPTPLALCFLGVLVLSNSLGAAILVALTLPLILFASPKVQLLAALLLVCNAIAYPLARAQNWYPTEALVEFAGRINAERASSLGFRFNQENALLARSLERSWFGWGGFARFQILDATTGQPVSVVDGQWIIEFGGRGTVGFLLVFGLLSKPVIRAWRRLRRVQDSNYKALISGLAIVVGVYMTDLIPNGMFTLLPWLLGGALLGMLHYGETTPSHQMAHGAFRRRT